MEQQGAAGLTEWQVAHLVKDDEVNVHEPMGQLPSLALTLLGFQQVDQFHSREEAHPLAMGTDGMDTQASGQVRLAGAWATHEDNVVG